MFCLALLPIPGDTIICAATGAVLRTGGMVRRHPRMGAAQQPWVAVRELAENRRQHGLTVVTRDRSDFDMARVPVMNPWEMP
jgi:hypothetical protein